MIKRVLKTCKFVLDVKNKFANVKRVDRPRAEWLKGRVQEMGVSFIKVGQFVSSRRDIFDETIVDAMKGLQDNVSPAPEVEMKEIILDRLGPVLGQISKIESAPIAAASIGQVHIAEMKRDKKKIALKVRRPHVQSDINMDIAILMNILTVMDLLNTENIKETKELLDSFRTWLLEETDYIREIENWKLLKESLNTDAIVLPTMYAQMCFEDFVVMEYVPSEKIRVAMKRLSKPERKVLAEQLMDNFVGQLILSGVMHGDPHEGNMGITADNKIVLYDMGNIIQVDLPTRVKLKQLLFHIVSEDFEEAVATMKKISLFDVRDEAKVVKLLEQYSSYLKTMDVNVFMATATTDSNMRGALPVKFDSTVFRIVRVFGLLEGICKDLDPEFSYQKIFAKYVELVGGMGGETNYVSFKMVSDVRKLAKMVIKSLDAL